MYARIEMPVSVGGFLFGCCFPPIVAAALLFPIYAPWRFRVIVSHGQAGLNLRGFVGDSCSLVSG